MAVEALLTFRPFWVAAYLPNFSCWTLIFCYLAYHAAKQQGEEIFARGRGATFGPNGKVNSQSKNPSFSFLHNGYKQFSTYARTYILPLLHPQIFRISKPIALVRAKASKMIKLLNNKAFINVGVLAAAGLASGMSLSNGPSLRLSHPSPPLSPVWTASTLMPLVSYMDDGRSDVGQQRKRTGSPSTLTSIPTLNFAPGGDSPIYRIVLTGGPCGGKSTAMAHISDRLASLGFRVYRVPEAATLLITAIGLFPPQMDHLERVAFEGSMIKTKIALGMSNYLKSDNTTDLPL